VHFQDIEREENRGESKQDPEDDCELTTLVFTPVRADSSQTSDLSIPRGKE
jgi:hypothetical protein